MNAVVTDNCNQYRVIDEMIQTCMICRTAPETFSAKADLTDPSNARGCQDP